MRFYRQIQEARFSHLYSITLINVFVLLLVSIIFLPGMISSSGFSIELPEVITAEPVHKKGYIITLTENGQIVAGEKSVSVSDLKNYLLSKKEKGFNVLIKVDRRVTVDRLAKVWDVCRSAGAANVSIATNE